MSLGLMMHANWDRMNSGQLQHYKTDRPVYSTPHPVQSTPANNECKLVELRGADVASFVIGDEEYICLPQVFDLFLKHLVGGLHTVYTKLKRLDITPVVCNVEQVRVLRGLGAIQPGVNRCKLITRKDFEALYRDCTTASRPGRPPKRYSIPSTSDLMSYHNEHQPANALRGMMNTTDVRNFHKRMRMEREASFDQHQSRRLSTSPTRKSPPAPDKYLSRAGAGDLYANAANIYLQQALRHQYQQFIANGIHNGVNFQHNPELAPFVGMAKTGFNGAMQPGFLAQFEEQRRKEMRQFSNETKNLSNDLNLHSTSGVDQRQENLSTSCSPLSQHGDKKTSNSPQHTRSSPAMKKHNDDNSFSREEKKHTPDLEHYPQTFFDDNNKTKSPKFSMNHDADQIETSANDKNSRCASDDEPPRSPPMDSNISSMQTLLSNIQGLLKVAADNAKFQEKQMSFELAEMRSRLEKEQELREETERRLEESRRMTASMQRKLDYERETRRRLQEQKLIAQDALTKGSTENSRSSPVGQRFQTVQATDSSERKSPNLTSSNIHSSVKPTSSPELSPMSSSSCLVSPCSVDEYSSTRNSRCSVSAENDNGHRSNRSTPECNVDLPVNMTKEQKEWIPCDVAQ